MSKQSGTLVGIARREKKFAAMEELGEAGVTMEAGVADDSRGRRRENAGNDRQVTVMSAAAWRDVCAELDAEIPWTYRRANLLIDGLDLKETTGARITIGELELEVTQEVDPCDRMDAQLQGLTRALQPDWRGGVGCRILSAGTVRIGDPVTLTRTPA